MKKEFPCVELTMEFFDPITMGEWRVWIEQSGLETTKEEDIFLGKLVTKIGKICRERENPKDKQRKIAKLEKVNAVQYRSMAGNIKYGVVAYTVDFDLHG